MRCNNCGFEQEQEFSFCPQCGAPEQTSVVPQASAAQKILSVLKDPLFLGICILMSASSLLSLSEGNLPLLNILTTVFLWLTYAQSRKDIADAKHLRCVSGTVYAQYVINYVAAGLVLVLGVIFAVAFSFLANSPEFLETLLFGVVDADSVSLISGIFASLSGWLLFFLCALVSAIVVVINLFSLRYIHQFVKSVYESLESGTLELQAVKKAQIWLFIFAAFSAINVLSSFSDGNMMVTLSEIANCGTPLLAALLIRKHLPTNE